jgi:serine/threonine protein phosphatase 1
MRTLVMRYTRGLRALHQIMERAKVTAEDSLIFFDYVDGWSQSPQVPDYLIELNSQTIASLSGEITMNYYCIG